MSIIYYQIRHDQIKPETINEVFERVSALTKNTDYEMPLQFNYGPILKRHIAALH